MAQGEEAALGEATALSDLANLDTMVTVIDCRNFLEDLKIGKDLQSVGQAATEDGIRTMADLLIDQVEFADVIVLNKIDLANDDEIERVKGFVEQLHPDALKLTSEFGCSEC